MEGATNSDSRSPLCHGCVVQERGGVAVVMDVVVCLREDGVAVAAAAERGCTGELCVSLLDGSRSRTVVERRRWLLFWLAVCDGSVGVARWCRSCNGGCRLQLPWWPEVVRRFASRWSEEQVSEMV